MDCPTTTLEEDSNVEFSNEEDSLPSGKQN